MGCLQTLVYTDSGTITAGGGRAPAVALTASGGPASRKQGKQPQQTWDGPFPGTGRRTELLIPKERSLGVSCRFLSTSGSGLVKNHLPRQILL